MVRGGGLEPPHHFWRQDLNLVRLPISPSSREGLLNKSKGRPEVKNTVAQRCHVLLAFQLQARILLDFFRGCLVFWQIIHEMRYSLLADAA